MSSCSGIRRISVETQVGAQIGEIQHAIITNSVANRMLHEGVCHEDEIAREPTPGGEADSRKKMCTPAEPSLAIQEDANECALQKERKHSFHGESLADDAACIF